jgi:hypothetical protein
MDGKTVIQIGAIPTPHGSDGGLAFDTTGVYGHVLLASTGGSDAGPGAVYTVSANGTSHLLGNYAGPGGVEQLAIAPPHFGAVSGQVLLTIDQHDHHGRLLAMDPHGNVQTLVTGLTWGLNPITPLTPGQAPVVNGVAPGLYMADYESHNVFYAPGNGLAQYTGDLFLATERRGFMYVLQAQGNGYHLQPLTTNLKAPNYNMEGVAYISG